MDGNRRMQFNIETIDPVCSLSQLINMYSVAAAAAGFASTQAPGEGESRSRRSQRRRRARTEFCSLRMLAPLSPVALQFSFQLITDRHAVRATRRRYRTQDTIYLLAAVFLLAGAEAAARPDFASFCVSEWRRASVAQQPQTHRWVSIFTFLSQFSIVCWRRPGRRDKRGV